MSPNRPTLLSRSFSTRTIRIALIFGLIAVTASVLSSTSLADTISQKFFTRAVALVTGEQMAPASHTLSAEEAVAAPVESTTMLVERRGHTATRLADGRVLIAGGENGSGTLNETEIYDPASGTFSAAANMATARADHSATLLADGRVLIAGGHNGATSLTSTELFDPSSGAFSNGPSMSVARAGHSATLLANGRVFVAGGDAAGSAEIFNASAGTFTAAGSLGTARSMHSAALLQDGRVLIVGGHDDNGDALFTGEIFDTPAGTFSDVGNALKASRVRAHMRVLFDGKVQIIGGNNDGSMELYDPLYEGFGGYAHVLPEGDTCVGVSGQIQNTQTRAALFHNGQTDALFDRSGHTITELNGKALVLGGANSSGAVLNSSAVLVSSGASVSTDKMDYAPGETAHITGRGFQPGEVVRLKIHEDPHTPQERGFDATADADGNFSGDYLVTEYDIDMKFIVGVRGLTSGATAQTTMTDANPQTIAVAAPTSVTVIQGATANYGNVTVAIGGNANPCTVTLGVTAGLPAGATPVFGNSPATTTGAAIVSTFSVTTTAATVPGTYTFQVTGTNSGAGCQGAGPTNSANVTLIVNSATVNTTTTVANATATYGDTSVTLNATVTPASGPAVNNGSVTFTVKQGATTIGAATTDNTVVAGAASVSYALPAGTNAGAYTIQASYTPGAGFNASSGTGSLTINKRAATWTTNAASKTYGDADPSPLTTGSGTNFVAADNVTATYSRAAGENASPPTYHITATLSATPAAALNNYTITNNGAEFTINKRAATWTTNAASKTYGDADPSPLTTGSGSNFVAADNVTATYSRAAGENASPPTYHITATLSATPAAALNNYTITNNGAEFTINKRAATWTTNAASKTYGDADPSPLTTGSGSNFVAADNVTATYSRAAGENASPPTYHITATLSATPAAALDNYIITNTGAEFTINKRLATWTTNAASKTYGDADPSPLTTGSGTNFVAADNVTATYSRAAGENASPPTYHITATLSATPAAALDNYIITNNGAEFTINKRPATWTTNAASKTYGDADPSPLTTGSGSNFVAADNVTATYSRAAGGNASPPTYHITATLSATPASALDNYIVTNTGAEFTINKRLATWTTNAASKTYGDADPSPLTTGSGTNFVAADNVTATYNRAAGENASPPTYHITATLSATPAAALDNYIITNEGAEFTINKRLATWTTNAASKTYGDADPSPLTTGSGTNFVAADNVTATYSRAAGENASPPTYHITATLSATPASALDNYIVTNTGAEFTINKRLATWTTNAASKTYGDADPSPLTTGSGTNFVAADNVTATYSRAAGENASPPTYHITATLSATPAAALDNYIITNAGAEFTINKRAATWTTNAASKTYGDADPSPLTTGSGSNFVAADNVTATYFRTAGENASPPTYHITATLSATPATALDNYIITNEGAEFTINKRLATWTTNPASKTYGDADPSPLTTGSGTNFVAADNVTATYSRAAGENASPPTYHITATLSATPAAALDNYIITNNGAEFTINKRLATWTTNAASKTYGDADPSPLTTGSGTNFVAADNVTATYSRAAGENASPPTYHITATLSATPLSALDNYIITNEGAEFTINKRLATWTTNAASKTYGDSDPSPLTTGSGTNFVAADNVTATYSRAAGENASPPTYHITATLSATPASALDNYIITNNGAEFTINKRLATWTTNPNSKTYGDADPSPLTTGSGTNFVAADNVTATYSRAAGENASPPTYHITATLSATPAAALDNYIITNDGAEFTINKRLATWTTNAASKTYGDVDPSPLTTGSGTNFVAADNVTATYFRTAGENASPPTYHITAALNATPLSALDNYIITNDGAEFTINKRLATWTTNPASKTYGDSDPSPLTTGSGTNFVAADNVTATYFRTAGENASPPTYHITAALNATPLSALDNYIITNDGAEFTINKRLATWTTNPASKTYGDSDPSPLTTGSGTNFVAADNVTATYFRTAGENASPPTYHITAALNATPLSALDNYIITNDGAEFTINKRLATWTTNPNSKTYGDPDPTPITSGNGSNFVAADNVTATYSRVAGENASPPTYHITATLSATPLSALDNYIITNDGAEFSINKRLATWTTNPNSKTYGDGDPSPITTGSGTNFVAADNVTATYSRVAGENASPPTYHITATLSATPLSALDNYIITNEGAEFTINKRLATWTTNPNSKTYGDPDPTPITTGSGSNFVAADNVTATYNRVAGENASPPTYHITATLSATPLSALDNYIITNDGAEFSINKRLATWTTNPASKTYGDVDPSPVTTGSGSNFVAADNVTATYSRVAGEIASPPTYHITATLSATPASALNNYIITNDGAEFTINKRAATWTTNPASKTYGNADPSPLTTGSGSNFVAADNVTATYSRAAGENASPPTYHITATLSATPASALDNYIITNDGAEFTINKRLATWTTNPASKTYGNADPSPLTTGSGSNFVAADNVTATYSRVAGENASPPTYHITATLSATPLSALDNYTITNNGAEFTINKRPIQVTANAGQFKTYGDPDPTFTYTLTSGTLAFTDTFTGALSRVTGQNVGLYALTVGSLHVNDGNGGNNYNLTFVSKNFEIKKRLITVKADPKTKTFGNPDPAFTYQITSGSLAFSDTFTGALTRDPGELVGQYTIKIGTLAINDGNGGLNYTLTFVQDKLTIVTACSTFNGFLSPIGGAVEFGTGGSFNDPIRAFKLNSTIPVKFTAICSGVPLTTGVHTLQAVKYSNATDGDAPIDATPTDAATDGNQFRLTGTEWHFNMNTKALGGNAQGTYLLKATLFDGSSYSVWVSIKK